MTFDYSKSKKQLFINAIQNALMKAKKMHSNNNLTFRNGLALYSLNFIFKELEIIKDNTIEVIPFKQGPYEQVLIYDNEYKMLISLTSQNNLKRLGSRKFVDKMHYIDALLSYNEDIPCDKQMTFFEGDLEKFADNKERLKREIERFISTKEIDYYMILEHKIIYKEFAMLKVQSKVLSPEYALIFSEDWGNYIKPMYDFVLMDDSLTNEAPKETKDSPYVKEKELTITLKRQA